MRPEYAIYDSIYIYYIKHSITIYIESAYMRIVNNSVNDEIHVSYIYLSISINITK